MKHHIEKEFLQYHTTTFCGIKLRGINGRVVDPDGVNVGIVLPSINYSNAMELCTPCQEALIFSRLANTEL